MRTRTRGTLYDLATQHARALEARESAVAQEMLAAWSDAYWAIRQDLDGLVAQIARARAAGEVFSPSWLSRRRRLQTVLATVRREMATYADHAASLTTDAQRAAMTAAMADATALGLKALEDAGLDAGWDDINPANVRSALGLTGNGSPVRNLMATIGPDVADHLRGALVQGLAKGWGQDQFVRAFTRGAAVGHTRATTIMRTESLRVYRETSRQSYDANTKVIGTWTWYSALDRRTCVACVAMHGTEHPTTETLDGHPRCRCAMVPRTRSWQELGVDLPDDRPVIETGAEWLERQSPTYQRALMGPGKFDGYRSGQITLGDMVARRDDPDWGTMRTERSLVSIRENRNANWFGMEPDNLPDAPVPGGLTADQIAALDPSMWGAWSSAMRLKVGGALMKTPEGKTLMAVVENFQRSYHYVRAHRIVETHMLGGGDWRDLPEVTGGRYRTEELAAGVEALRRCVASYDQTVPELFRGMSVPGNLDAVLDAYREGRIVDLGASSFTSDADVARGFVDKGNRGDVAVTVHLSGGNALPVQNMTSGENRDLWREREWIAQGRFRVVRVVRGRGKRVDIYLEPVR